MRFDELKLDEGVLQGIEAMNFQDMTPVQELTIPVILEGKDIIACAQTGTGKTAAYSLPLLNRLTLSPNHNNKIKAVIMVPTRELAQQIDMQFMGFSYFLPVSTAVVYGGGDGDNWEQQKRGLRNGADIVIATPGRLISHISHSDIDLSHVEYFILDEADRMLDMGFYDDIMQIVNKTPESRQTIMFSATLPPKIREMAKKILHNPEEVNIAISKPNEAILQSAYVCYETQKMEIIKSLFSKPVNKKVIIFSSSKQKVKDLAHSLKRLKLNVAAMHSDLSQEEREKVMLDFKNNKINILVATDIVARGIDIEDIGLVLNYDVPHDPEDYIHRIGRTARANTDGVAITFVSEAEQGKFHKIETFLEKTIYKIPMPTSIGSGPEYNPEQFEKRGRRPYNKDKNRNFKRSPRKDKAVKGNE
ncbi:MAG: DEAD/DEAH box helicase [Marinifilaceae bacterium]